MKVVLSDRAVEALKDAPAPVRRAFNKQLQFLLHNLNHPSLHAKKYGNSGFLVDSCDNFRYARSRTVPEDLGD